MRNLKTALFIIAMVTITAQTFRHIYVKFFSPSISSSVLDQFEDENSKRIEKASTLSELVEMYSKKKNEIDVYKKEHIQYEKDEIYKGLEKDLWHIGSKVNDIEGISRQKSKIITYWLFGLFFLICGCLVYTLFEKWLGIGLIIAGFSEMIYWTSPIFDLLSAFNFADYQTIILLLSVTSLFLLILLWLVNEILIDKKIVKK